MSEPANRSQNEPHLSLVETWRRMPLVGGQAAKTLVQCGKTTTLSGVFLRCRPPRGARGTSFSLPPACQEGEPTGPKGGHEVQGPVAEDRHQEGRGAHPRGRNRRESGARMSEEHTNMVQHGPLAAVSNLLTSNYDLEGEQVVKASFGFCASRRCKGRAFGHSALNLQHPVDAEYKRARLHDYILGVWRFFLVWCFDPFILKNTYMTMTQNFGRLTSLIKGFVHFQRSTTVPEF